MTITTSTVSLIQKAGQTLHDASQALSKDALASGERLHRMMTAEPYGPSADAVFHQWKTLARLAQELSQMEEAIRTVYSTGMAMASKQEVDIPVIAATKRQVIEVQDVQEKPKKPGPRTKKLTSKAKKVAGTPRPGNEQHLMDYLLTVLSDAEMTKVTQQAITDATGIPAGSIAATMKRLVSKHLVEVGSRGEYRLTDPA